MKRIFILFILFLLNDPFIDAHAFKNSGTNKNIKEKVTTHKSNRSGNCIQGNCQDGYGTFTFSSGAKYVG